MPSLCYYLAVENPAGPDRTPDRLLALALLLTGIPLIIVGYWTSWTGELGRKRELGAWEQEARNRVEEFRTFFSARLQFQRFFQEIREEVRRDMLRRGEKTLRAETLAGTIRRHSSPVLRGKGMQVFAFSFPRPDSVETLRHPDFAVRGGAFLGKLFQDLVRLDGLGFSERKELNQRLEKVFGIFVDGDLLRNTRQGKLIKARYEGKPVTMVWDEIKFRERAIGALVIMYPEFPEDRRFWSWGMRKAVLKQGTSFLPLLVPLSSVGTETPPLSLKESRNMPRLLTALAELRDVRFRAGGVPDMISRGRPRIGVQKELSNGNAKGGVVSYDSLAPISTAFARDSFLLYRTGISPELPFEIWILGPPLPVQVGRMVALVLGWSGFWLSVLFIRMWRDRPFAISMQTRLIGLLGLVGGIPLIGFFLLGSGMVQQREDQGVERARQGLRSFFQELDENSVTQLSRFSELSNRYFDSHELSDELFASGPPSITPVLRRCFRNFAAEGMPLDAVLVARFGRDQFRIPEGLSGVQMNHRDLLTFAPWLYGPLRFFEPTRSKVVEDSLPEAFRLGYQGFVKISDETATLHLPQMRKLGWSMAYGERNLFTCYDLPASGGRMLGAIAFRSSSDRLYDGYLCKSLVRAARLNPTRPLGMVWINQDQTVSRVFFPGSSRNRERFRERLRGLAAQRADAATHRKDKSFLVYSCRRMQGFTLGGMVEVGAIRRAANRERGYVLAGTIVLGALLVLIGTVMSGFFLSPLRALRDGLDRILDRHFDVRLRLERDDELGEVADRFDRMAEKLEERYELARFVSGSLAAKVTETIQTSASPQRRRLAVLATDIRGFTTLTETYPAPEIVAMLNVHLETMSDAITSQGGRIEKFIGDAIIASFAEGTPERMTAKAVAAGQAMMRAHSGILQARLRKGGFGYGMGVGISFGEVLAGSFGDESRREFSLIGHPMDESEKMEALSKQGKFTRIIVAASACAHLQGLALAALGNTPHQEVVEL